MEYKPLSGREFPRFSAIKTFFRLPYVEVDADYEVGIFGIPYDGGVSYRPGSRFAPAKVREVSSLGRGFHMTRAENFFEKLKVADIGDCPTVPIDQKQTYEKIEKFVGELVAKNKRFLAVGGDHSTTLPVLRALRKKYGKPLAFIHWDAHLDTYPAAWGQEYHHGAFARHAVEEGLVDPKKMIQIGIRGPLAGGDDLDFVNKHGIRVITVDEIRNQTLNDFLKTLPTFDDTPTYISYDVDALDPSCAPGTGTPVPGGLTTYEAQRIFRALQIKNLIGGDVVEVCPAFDNSDITALAALDALFEMLHLFEAK
ncbi:agmatinase [Bdellovibrio reynosensis]|uniref:Agmatinase n=1 Tax=Bdellovibrio reynosensis TaxID=2835041 RepID=A0ABY4C7D6_9BACT|nr:agmatinase [Bdellovibrio reynosensis]UOF00825.1 agmatinase [Bdellovibrio reynosensis]